MAFDLAWIYSMRSLSDDALLECTPQVLIEHQAPRALRPAVRVSNKVAFNAKEAGTVRCNIYRPRGQQGEGASS
jgi:hypothetical protein